ncbi:6,7-dimethyl-8-ribityllumazine synthase [Malassezia psittaci]|uniref:6,7-dimethyl-8-ribityllumazine synthase n=1 Tax=Malassezia psittaci TaxID=1821823 RepID=A0AAF0F6R7_9BASI|nr:6,7-dimethyl-8-ribityllumazine synthase [Malassezia psittaci]
MSITGSIKGPAPAPTSFPGANKLRIGIVHARWNKQIIDALVAGAVQSLEKAGVPTDNIKIRSVPGSWELPTGCQTLLAGSSDDEVDAVIGIGCLIKGSTMHFEYICDCATHGLMRLNLDYQKPVILGILTVLNEDQGLERAGIGRNGQPGHNHGEDWGFAAVEMALMTKGNQ